MTTTNVYGRQVVVPLTNKSGGGVIAGDVVVVDTSNNDAFTTSTAGAFTGLIGVAQETIANNATGRVLTAGYAALVNTSASVTRGNFGKTHTVVKQAVDAGSSRVSGAFCQFLTGGTTPDAHVFGIADSSSGGSTAAVGAKATKNATQPLTSATETAVTWPGTDLFDTDSIHDPSTNSSRMTIPAAKGGQYLVSASVQFVANANGFRYIFFKVNGTTSSDYVSELGNASAQYMQTSTVLSLSAGDYVETWAYQSSGGGLNVDTNSWFSISRLGT